MSAMNQARSHTLSRIAEGKLSMADGARQAGPAALVHGNTGRASPHRIDPAIRTRVVELATTRYAGIRTSLGHHPGFPARTLVMAIP